MLLRSTLMMITYCWYDAVQYYMQCLLHMHKQTTKYSRTTKRIIKINLKKITQENISANVRHLFSCCRLHQWVRALNVNTLRFIFVAFVFTLIYLWNATFNRWIHRLFRRKLLFGMAVISSHSCFFLSFS